MKEKEKVQTMFDDISGRYDFLNHFLSLGIDFTWRNKFVRQLSRYKPGRVLDVATGTGDLALLISRKCAAEVTGVDISAGMLTIANRKAGKEKPGNKITFCECDAEALPFADDTFDAVTVAFGVRNFEHLEKGLAEMRRVLKTGGVMQILEFSHPSAFPVKQLYSFYSRFMIPFFGKVISRNKEAYTYLPETVSAFPSGSDFTAILGKVGMINVSERRLTFGVSTIYSGRK
jgi:demethylmenaquinone methyltransferase / 2-methoxy-6-polyprenyl-1,4-benzoquinol methylase